MATFRYADGSPVLASDPSGLISIAELRLNPDPGANTVICDGMGWPIAQLSLQLPPILDKCISDCLLIHEYSHIDDLKRLGILGRVCKGQARGTGITVPPEMHDDSEKRAYQAELDCLEKKLSRLTECDECRAQVEKRIKDAKMLKARYK